MPLPAPRSVLRAIPCLLAILGAVPAGAEIVINELMASGSDRLLRWSAAGVPALDGFLVTEMWRADAELILGIQHDPDFGPMVMVGAGGVLVELMKDVQLAPAPLSHATARRMLARLRSLPLLTGFRGRPPADLDTIADVLVRLGTLAAGAQGQIRELDINPLFVAGNRVVAADARATLARVFLSTPTPPGHPTCQPSST